MKIAVTGTFGTGKTAFAEMLSGGNMEIISGDIEGKRLLLENWDELSCLMGLDGMEYNIAGIRKALKCKGVFSDYNQWMSARLPAVILNKMKSMNDVIVDAALILEWGIEKEFDTVILVMDGDFDERFSRISKSREADIDIYRIIDRHQIADEDKMLRCNIIIENRGDLDALREKADSVRALLFA